MSTATTVTTAPAYVTFTAALRAMASAQGIVFLTAATESGLPQNEGYCFLRTSEGGAALIIPKSKGKMGNVHSHVDLSDLDGFIPLPKKNGKVICHFAPVLSLLGPALARLNGASKRATIVASKAPVSTTPVYSQDEYEAEFETVNA